MRVHARFEINAGGLFVVVAPGYPQAGKGPVHYVIPLFNIMVMMRINNGRQAPRLITI